MVDFIIVGRGLAATVMAHRLHQDHLSFHLIGPHAETNSSLVAGGIWNPIVFKRLTKSWLANDLVPELNRFYSACEKDLGQTLLCQRSLVKPFVEEQEKVLWTKKAAGELSDFLDPKIYTETSEQFVNCKISNAYGAVKQSGNINMAAFINGSAEFFKSSYHNELFEHALLTIEEDHVSYKGLKAKNILFCEGYLVKNNPYFNWIPLKPAKGEVFIIESNDLKLNNCIFNKNGFLMDLGNKRYKVGATYAWDDLTEEPTEAGASELHNKLKQLISCEYSLIKHEAGIRPSSIDRRPIIGTHPQYKNLFIFNGLGTKGVMLAPYFAKNFVNFYLEKESIHEEVNVKRFYKDYAATQCS